LAQVISLHVPDLDTREGAPGFEPGEGARSEEEKRGQEKEGTWPYEDGALRPQGSLKGDKGYV